MRKISGRFGARVLALIGMILAAAIAAPAQTYGVLHRFIPSEGEDPEAGLIMDTAGNLYGTTTAGGANGEGTVFKLGVTGDFAVLHNFPTGDGDGQGPFSQLTIDSGGNLYGTTAYGGSGFGCLGIPCGIVFKLDPTGTETILHSFADSPDGALPYAGLVRDSAGNLYGVTQLGGDMGCGGSYNGAYGCGTVFELSTTGAESVLYAFSGGADGEYPLLSAGLLLDPAGNLWGTTERGGTYDQGTVFEVQPKGGREKVLYTFTGGKDGGLPAAGLIHDSARNFYGTTIGGGASGWGMVFKLDRSGNESVLYSFTGGTDGSQPEAALVRDAAGNLFGTTSGGGAFGRGTVFELNANGQETVLHSFAGGADGQVPVAPVTLVEGSLYGTTELGGNTDCYQSSGCGTIFRLLPTAAARPLRLRASPSAETLLRRTPAAARWPRARVARLVSASLPLRRVPDPAR